MKTPLKISVLLNALLLAGLGASLWPHGKFTPAPVAAAVVPETVVSPRVPARQEFRWNQLESTNDYRTYVSNLRGIGCPEPTIRAIVTADFEAASSFEQNRLKLAGNSTVSVSSEATKQAITAALGTEAAPSRIENPEARPASTTNPLPSPSVALRPAGKMIARASYPVAFQNAVLNDSTLTQNQKAAVRQLQQQFVDALGGPNQNPSEPTYAMRWQTAQQDADDGLRAQLGSQAYLSYKLQHYYANFQQVMLSAGDGPVTIDPEQLAK